MSIIGKLFKKIIGGVGSIKVSNDNVQDLSPEKNDEIYKKVNDSPDDYRLKPESLSTIGEIEQKQVSPPVYGPPPEDLIVDELIGPPVYGPPPEDLIADELMRKSIMANLVAFAKHNNHWEITLDFGREKSVVEGDVGKFYIDYRPINNSTFRITKVLYRRCIAVTDATVEQIPQKLLKKAKVFINKHN